MLAIVIPYFKITFFEETLQSLAQQTDKRFKVYIGDDNSAKNPLALLEHHQENFDFKYKKFDKNLGGKSLVKQWERCLEMVQNEKWIMILGDDDILEKNVVEEFYNNLAEIKGNFNVVRFSTLKINEVGDAISKIYKNEKIETAIDFLFNDNRSSLSEYIFNYKKVNEIKIKNFPLAWFSDILAVIEISEFGKIFSINDAVVKIRISTESISGSSANSSKKLEATFQFYFYLLYKKKSYFNQTQRKILIQKLEKSYFNKKKHPLNFLKVSYLYLKYFSVKEYLIFLKLFFNKIRK